MSSLILISFVSLLLVPSTHALPPPAPGPPNSTDIEATVRAINAISGSSTPAKEGLIGPDPFQGYLGSLEAQRAGTAPATTEDVLSTLSQMDSGTQTNLYTVMANMISAGITTTDIRTIANGGETGPGSTSNNNPKEPAQAVFPQKDAGDAPYSLDENTLRGAIFIPSTFTYGQKPPVILTPGTGNTGYESFNSNFIKLLSGQSYADPVWLNIPGNLVGDAQVNSEYVAYAMNYISGVSGQNVSVISWSQGGPNAQWALKYWPSTRPVTSNLIAISPDYKGTVEAFIACPGFPINLLACGPAIIQQESTSNFIETLRADGGDSAYVPTTTVYSSTDEVVQPQSGTGASAFMLDARNVGVSNSQVQVACAGETAGGFYTHEGVLYNSLAVELAKDALMNGGPGQLSRIDKAATCALSAAAGLDTTDVLGTETALLYAGVNVLTFPQRVVKEPPIKSYAVTGKTGGIF